jgi:hypothetical protein
MFLAVTGVVAIRGAPFVVRFLILLVESIGDDGTITGDRDLLSINDVSTVFFFFFVVVVVTNGFSFAMKTKRK